MGYGWNGNKVCLAKLIKYFLFFLYLNLQQVPKSTCKSMTVFNVDRKATVYRKDFVQKLEHVVQRSQKPEDSLTVYHKNFQDPFLRKPCKVQYQLSLIEHQLEGFKCTSDMWPFIKQKIVAKRALIRRRQTNTSLQV